jgi:hypothetical protein
MMLLRFLILLLCCTFSAVANPYFADSLNSKCVLISDIEDAAGDAAALISNTGMSTLWISAGALVATGMLIPADQEMRNLVLRNRHSDEPAHLINEYGGLVIPAGIAGTLYLGGILAGSDEIRNTGRLTVEALLLSGLITTTLKSVLGRSRPFMEQGTWQFNWFETNDAMLSLPSGHTTVAFATSTVLASRIDRWWADIALYGLAAGTAWARMYKDKHWFSDTVLGGAIGYLSAKAVLKAAERDNSGAGKHTEVLPVIMPGRIGMMISW